MAKSYRPYFPEQDFLLPPSLREWLAEDHLAYFVSDLIDELDLGAIESYYEREERGYPPPSFSGETSSAHPGQVCGPSLPI